MLYAVQKLRISMVDIKYMESGHNVTWKRTPFTPPSNMLGNINQSTLPRSGRSWLGAAEEKPKPYNVTTMKHTDFVDVKLLARQIGLLRNRRQRQQVEKQCSGCISNGYDLRKMSQIWLSLANLLMQMSSVLLM